MPHIQRLPASVVNQIAAGEVIERPASVVKEMLENSIDAGATRVEISVVKGGTELIRVADDGHGIAADELTLAVDTHATSKLRTADDLQHVGTLGFRGEALASIAEVSRFTIRSRPRGESSGAELSVRGGERQGPAPCGCPEGTIVEVGDLFFNTPVRRRFLRSTQTEMGHISEAVARLALANPHVHFTLRHNQRIVHDLPPADPWSARMGQLFGSDILERLVWVDSSDDDVRLSGYVGLPELTRSNSKMHYLLLNGRYIRDRSLQHALGEAYRGLILTGRFPIAFLRLDMPAEQVDVNVHPTKLEVRFRDGGRVYSQLLATLRTKFLSTDLTHRLAVAPGGGSEAAANDPARARFGEPPEAGESSWRPDRPGGGEQRRPGGPLELFKLDRDWQPAGRARPRAMSEQGMPGDSSLPANVHPDIGSDDFAVADITEPDRELTSADADNVRAIQIHNRYLIAETGEGVIVIDQHALHERIIYEQLRGQMLTGQLESQNLLVPEPVDLTNEECAAVLDRRDMLAELGIRVEEFGGATVLVASYPAMLRRVKPAEIVREMATRLTAGDRPPDRRDLFDEMLNMMSCKAAVKAGDYLSPEEVQALVQNRHLVDDAHHCPHGRPTTLMFTREQLDRQFRRT